MSRYSGGIMVVLVVVSTAQAATIDPTGTCKDSVFTRLGSMRKLLLTYIKKEVNFLAFSKFLVSDAFDECRLVNVKTSGNSVSGVVRIYTKGKEIEEGVPTVFTSSNGQLRAKGFLGDNRIVIVQCAPKNSEMFLIYWCSASGGQGGDAYSIGVFNGNKWTEDDYNTCASKAPGVTKLK